MAENAMSFFCSAEFVLKYALCNSYEKDIENEIARTYREESGAVSWAYSSLSAEEQTRISFPREVENELFRQMIAACQAEKLQNETGIWRAEADALRESLAERQRETDRLQNEITALEINTSKLRDETDYWQKEAHALQDEITGIHSSWTFRIGRTVTWLPCKIRGGVRCYMEHGLRYTIHRTFEYLILNVNKKL